MPRIRRSKSQWLRSLRLLYCGLHRACQTLVNKRQNASASDSCSNESIKLLITTNGKLQVARSYTLDTEIFRRVSYMPVSLMTAESAKILTGKFQHFGRQVFKNSRRVHSGFGPDTHVMLGSLFKISMNTSNRELGIMDQSGNST